MGSMIGNESVIRRIVVARAAVKEALGYEMKTFLEEEEFTFPQLPQIVLKYGFTCAGLARCDTRCMVGAPVMACKRIFGKGTDGSEIPALPQRKLYFHPPCVTRDIGELLTEKYKGYIRELTDGDDYPVFRFKRRGGKDNGSGGRRSLRKDRQRISLSAVRI